MILFPAVPVSADITLIDNGVTQRALSNKLTRHGRGGAHFRLDVVAGPFCAKDARPLIAKLQAAKNEGLRIAYPLLGKQCGNGLVAGANQTGTSLAVDGMMQGMMIREGYTFSIETAGKHYLYFVKDAARVASDGTATLSLTTPLRVSPADNDVVHFAKPYIEGIVEGEEWGWTLSSDRVIPISFSVEES